VVHIAPDACQLEIHSARLNLTFPPQSWRPPVPHPSVTGAVLATSDPRGSSVLALLRTEAGPAVEASPVAIGVMAAVNRLEHFCSSFSAIWTTHRVFLLSVDAEPHPTLNVLGWPIAIRGGNLAVPVKILFLPSW